MSNGISYPGDDGTEPPEVRARKAQEYAEKVYREADEYARAQQAEREKREWDASLLGRLVNGIKQIFGG